MPHWAQEFVCKSGLQMLHGGKLPEFTQVYETWGQRAADDSNIILLFTGLSPSAHAASHDEQDQPGWWEAVIGPGKAIDTNQYHVICINSLGSCFGSTGPASINPKTGKLYGPDFPQLAIEDIATAAVRLMEHLDIQRLHALVGPSMGGMSALAFSLQFQGSIERFLTISSTARAQPFSIAIRSLQREAIWSDAHFNGGWYHDGDYPTNGMRLARKLGVISYRSAQEWQGRFGREMIPPARAFEGAFAPQYEIESYLEAHAQRFVGSFDPNCYLQLSRSMDGFDPFADQDPIAILKRLKLQQVHVVGVSTDLLFPLHQQQALAQGFQDAGFDTRFTQLNCIHGHDAFLVDIDAMGKPIASALSD